ncbi:uncharacterized protein E0L32_005316 [Thyridium curvatum]|uniref:Uncharacterized protein n=1 Tax=Thyridium curvatum TaxID=1093900 RepID=A0A507B7L6_9PEZI|nr:uncharacterized protein E0L32_005316 [Thyridium curvatum]TPX14624.1 hypothetical protein E0L32_005316 [Thyridium curvatum]
MANTEPKFKAEIQQAGFTVTNACQQDPSNETIALVEDIIRNQVILMLTTANELAIRRGSRVFSNNDLIFQFRHDAVRVARIQTFLRWKSVRKTVKDDDDKGANPELVADEEVADEALNPAAVDAASKKLKQPAALPPWDIRCMYPEDAPGGGDDEDEDVFRDADDAALERLRRADQKTENMTPEEYATWSEYRHASFTYRKVKRFREWAGLGVIAEHKPVDDSLDILGFVTCEMVQRLTEIALSIQQRELASRSVGGESGPAAQGAEGGAGSLFTLPQTAKPAVDARHIRQAFHATQMGARRSHVRLNKMAPGGRLELI